MEEPIRRARSQTDGGIATRERILREAAALFANRGFHGTSTRDIAAAVGIRQPSLFHHFESKHAILADLLERDLEPAIRRIRCHRSTDASPAVRLYAYLVDDVRSIAESPYDARGMYNDEVLLAESALSRQRDLRKVLHEETKALVVEGIEHGDFRAVDPLFAQQVVTGMLLDTIWVVGTHLADDALGDRPHQVADFVLRGLLADVARLPEIHGAAAALDGGTAST
jgi:AcrR family transcriptional regulator